MSQATKIEFKGLVADYYQRYKNVLNVADPTFEEDGFITTAGMTGPCGRVEIRCGPAEYSAEVFVYTFKDQKRWTLLDLMSVGSVRDWMARNRPHISGRSRLEAEIDYIFCLVVDGLRGVADFDCLHEVS